MVRLRLGTIRHLYRLSLVNIDRTGPCIDLYRERGKGEGENRQFSMGVLGGMWEEERCEDDGVRERGSEGNREEAGKEGRVCERKVKCGRWQSGNNE